MCYFITTVTLSISNTTPVVVLGIQFVQARYAAQPN